ncbi:MAG: hypothetical protein Q4B82_07355 [Alysiella sp.]|uniref:hypothetical protein n=1 Tax=Alysiella sp. TaxID=1872483 RepID=UPI0026DC6CE9|nr:hypothetical protein [Alysiella sp.]MDO4434378.1 hypothetical protein [Alysiella sp.]
MSYIIAFALFFLVMKYALSPTKHEQKLHAIGLNDPMTKQIRWIAYACVLLYIVLSNL